MLLAHLRSPMAPAFRRGKGKAFWLAGGFFLISDDRLQFLYHGLFQGWLVQKFAKSHCIEHAGQILRSRSVA